MELRCRGLLRIHRSTESQAVIHATTNLRSMNIARQSVEPVVSTDVCREFVDDWSVSADCSAETGVSDDE